MFDSLCMCVCVGVICNHVIPVFLSYMCMNDSVIVEIYMR